MDEGKSNIFWGLIVKPSKRYETTVQEAFRITKACIEPATAKGDVSSVFVECDNQEEFIVANLQSKTLNESLDLTFGVGEKICFKVEGPGTVHLTGYLMEDDQPADDFYMDGDSAMEDSGESEEEDVQTKTKEDLKRKITTLDDGKKKKPKLEKESKPESIAKAKSPGDDSSDEDDSSDDEDSSEPAETTVDTTLGDLDDTENFAEEEDSESDDSDDSDDGEEEVDSSGAGIALGDATMESDDDDEDFTPPKEESPPKKKEKTPSKAKVNGDVKVKTPAKPTVEVKTPAKPAVEVKTPAVTAAKTPDVPKSEKKKKEKTNALETPKKATIVNGDGDAPKSEKKKKNKEAVSTPIPEVLKTPKQEKNDKEVKTPKQAKTPKEEVKTPAINGTPATNGKTPKSIATPGKTPKQTLKGGIQIEDTVVGSGAEVKKGSNVGMYYSGKLKNNKQFDSCTGGKPFKFRIGTGEVIKGWDIGIMGMKVGGKRTLLIPPQMAYGASGAPPDIPGNASLVFEVECKFVK